MLNTLSRPMVRIVDRDLPAPFVFALILTLVAGLAAALLVDGGARF
jgi:short-chain fatty acids transporter